MTYSSDLINTLFKKVTELEIDAGDLVVTEGDIDLVHADKKLLLPLKNDATAPTLAFGDGDTGIYENADDSIIMAFNETPIWNFNGNIISSMTTGGISLKKTAGTATSSIYTFNDDFDTGISHAGADALSLIAGGVEGHRITEAAGAITHELTGTVNNNSCKMAVIASGTYDGNDGANRAIPHTLGVVPMKVDIIKIDASIAEFRRVHKTYATTLSDTAEAYHTVTVWDSTNFYVGNAVSYDTSHNATGTTYEWVAFG